MHDMKHDGYIEMPGHIGSYVKILLDQAGDQEFNCALVRIEVGGGGPEQPYTHKGDLLIVVLEGTLTLRQEGKETVTLAPAAFLLDGRTPYSIWNNEESRLELVKVSRLKPLDDTIAEAVRMEEIEALALAFCDSHLNEEYRGLCVKLVERMAGLGDEAFPRGRADIWAGGVISAVGNINDLFRKKSDPHVSHEQVSVYFNATPQTIAKRGRQIRDMLGLEYLDPEFMVTKKEGTLARLEELAGPFDISKIKMSKMLVNIKLSRERAVRTARSERSKKRRYNKVYQFKIKLLGTNPTIWRRIQVPNYYTFWDLHVAIQDAMGWADRHLHRFEMRRPGKREHERIGMPSEEDIFIDIGGTSPVPLAGWEEKIADWFDEKNNYALYEYDFGDSWEHSVVLEKVLPREPGRVYPVCTGGVMGCPPEDCGGVAHYYYMLDALRDKSNPEHYDILEWMGPYFQPERFSAGKVTFDKPYERLLRAFGQDYTL